MPVGSTDKLRFRRVQSPIAFPSCRIRMQRTQQLKFRVSSLKIFNLEQGRGFYCSKVFWWENVPIIVLCLQQYCRDLPTLHHPSPVVFRRTTTAKASDRGRAFSTTPSNSATWLIVHSKRNTESDSCALFVQLV